MPSFWLAQIYHSSAIFTYHKPKLVNLAYISLCLWHKEKRFRIHLERENHVWLGFVEGGDPRIKCKHVWIRSKSDALEKRDHTLFTRSLPQDLPPQDDSAMKLYVRTCVFWTWVAAKSFVAVWFFNRLRNIIHCPEVSTWIDNWARLRICSIASSLSQEVLSILNEVTCRGVISRSTISLSSSRIIIGSTRIIVVLIGQSGKARFHSVESGVEWL